MNRQPSNGELAAMLLGRLHIRAGTGDFVRRALPNEQRVFYVRGRCLEALDRKGLH